MKIGLRFESGVRGFMLSLCCAAALTAFCGNYPASMYIKGDWNNNSNWVWHTMTTCEDGIYTYNAYWNNLYGCNINTSKSDSGSLWFKYNTIVGYDPGKLTYGKSVIFTYSAAGERLYVSPSDESSVNLILSEKEVYTNKELRLSAYCHNISTPSLSFSMIDPEGNENSLGNDVAYVTLTTPGSYTFTVKATPAPGNAGQSEATCSITCDVIEYIAPVPCPFTPTDEELKRAYHEDVESHDITFLFKPSLWNKSYGSVQSVYVSGSFNGWGGSGNQQFKLIADDTRSIFYLTVPYNVVKRPGNIGQPEYKFVIDGNYNDPYSGYPSDYIFNNSGNKNMMIIFSFDNLSEIREIINNASVIKKVSDFDLTTREGREEISNYRTVPGTTMLKRCYHPFKTTKRDDMTTEPVRIEYVNSLALADGVRSDICLSGDDTSNLGTYTAGGTTYTETIPPYYQEMLAGGHVLYVGEGYATPSYNEVYYNIRSENFGRWISDVADFIIDENNEGPYTIHCRLGTDRTGVFCATLAALCGASWSDIVTDYQKSNRMGINEYRNPKLLKYAFEDLLGVTEITDVPNFPETVQNYMVDKGYLTPEKISGLRSALNQTVSGIDVIDEDSIHNAEAAEIEIFDINGRKCTNPQNGIYIVKRNNSYEKLVVRK